MHPPAQATRRAQVVAAQADAVAAVDRPPPVHVAVDGCFLQHPGVRGRLGPGRVPAFGPSAGPQAVRGPRPGPAAARYLTQVDPEGAADVVVDLHDPGWPVIRRMSPALADRLGAEVFLAETRAFSARRAATWEARFPDDDPAYAAAVAEAGLHAGQTALDAGCGTGRALPHLRAAVGPTAGSSGSTSPRRCWPPARSATSSGRPAGGRPATTTVPTGS